MTVEETIFDMLWFYPGLFPTKGAALHHLFCVVGNGYEWKDGELVDKDWGGMTSACGLSEVDRQIEKSLDEINTAASLDLLVMLKINDLDHNQERMKVRENIEECMKDLSLDKELYRVGQHWMELSGFNVPDDVKDDWLEAAFEAISIVFGKAEDDEQLQKASEIIKHLNKFKLEREKSWASN